MKLIAIIKEEYDNAKYDTLLQDKVFEEFDVQCGVRHSVVLSLILL